MKFKRLLFTFFVVPLILLCFSITLYSGKSIDAAWTILPNGNWDLNYTPTKDIQGYYQGLSGLTGSTFENKLNEIISANVTRISYGGGVNQTRGKLKIIDESPRDSTKVLLLYSGNDIDKDASGNDWNQEHVWAKSHGFPGESLHAHSDLHHIRPTYNGINSTRGNLDFANASNYPGTVKDATYGNKYITDKLFEPRDAVKGDVARMMIYMDVRYNSASANGTKLTLVNSIPTSGTPDGSGSFGHLDTLLKWHNQDPVDDIERKRNDKIQEIQGNRNPFIDHPEFIEQVYNTPYTGGIPSEPKTDQEMANDVIAAINNIGNVTLSSKDEIDNAKNLYDSLTSTQKSLVTNYQLLLEAIASYSVLVSSVQTSTAYEGEFTPSNVSGTIGVYAQNVAGILNGKNWNFSYGYKDASEIRLGYNGDENFSSKYSNLGLGTSGSVLEMTWDISNASKISFTFKKNYGTISKIAIAVSYNEGASYSLVSQVDKIDDGITANVTPDGNMRFTLLVIGSKPRLVLDKVIIEKSIRGENLVSEINSIGAILLDTNTFSLLNLINNKYNNLSNGEKAVVTNYNLFLQKKNEFNQLVEIKALEVDNIIENVYEEFINNPFNSDIHNEIVEVAMTYEELLDFVIIKLENKDLYEELITYKAEATKFLSLIDILTLNKFSENSISEYLEFYNETFIKEMIDSNSYYLNITTKATILNHFMELKTLSSIMFSYDSITNTLIDNTLAIRFGAGFERELYESLVSLGDEVEFGVMINEAYFKLNPVSVSYIGAPEENPLGEYYQFAAVLKNMSMANVNTKLSAKVYVKIDNVYYYMTEVNRSFVDVAQLYLESGLKEIEDYLDILNSIVLLKKD